ncbi:hypothetical protein [Tychonema sp. LEGE 07203]|uniref:hypothetical protein n=1 Tax=Tychonema sp. LEGE 07203 TaxID=1828671 RepID=UPI00187EAA60|nr:hypothetical protein [Tychonema sp. LEGE 07203]MBE9094372.1 hypothetical protein [Tychonema sp. LEGE 07203]
MRSHPTIAPNIGVCALVAAEQMGILQVGNGDEVDAVEQLPPELFDRPPPKPNISVGAGGFCIGARRWQIIVV